MLFLKSCCGGPDRMLCLLQAYRILQAGTTQLLMLLQAERISICSIEKANGALNRMMQEQRLHELVSVTIDEAHMLADPHR